MSIKIKLIHVLFLITTIQVVAGLPKPQRLQLGGAGPRPVLLGAAPVPNYSQQLTFGGQQQPNLVQQDGNRGRFVPQNAQTAKPLVFQQGTNAGVSRHAHSPAAIQAPIGTFPIAPNIRQQQQFALRSPVSSASAADEEEYEDDDYSDNQAAPVVKAQVQPTARPVSQRGKTAGAARAQQPQSSFVFTQPQRLVPQQVQNVPATPTRSRQPTAQPQPAQLLQQGVYANPFPQTARLGQDSRIAAGDDRQTTPKPVQTLNRFMRQNEDGSITWGYESEDGSFKEETLGADCVVRGKYGYVDPEGQKREYEYQTGNPCDPNKRGQEEDEEELDEQTRLGGLLSSRPGQLQLQQRRQ